MDTLGLFSHCQILCDFSASPTVKCDFVSPLQKGENILEKNRRTSLPVFTVLYKILRYSKHTYNTLFALSVRQCMCSKKKSQSQIKAFNLLEIDLFLLNFPRYIKIKKLAQTKKQCLWCRLYSIFVTVSWVQI